MVATITQTNQRYVQLSAALEQGEALWIELEKQPLFLAQGSIERNKSYYQRVHAWIDAAKKVLQGPELEQFDAIMQTPTDPSWRETWNVLMVKQASSWTQTDVFQEVISQVLAEQLALLRQLRLLFFPGTPLSDHLANRYCIKFNKLGEVIIDRFFMQNGCAANWWLPPRSIQNSKSHTRVLGWLDGIALHQPKQLITIMQAVLDDLVAHRGSTEPDRELLRALEALAR